MANVDGISKKIVTKNTAILQLGICSEKEYFTVESASSVLDVLLDPINIIFILIIFILGFLDYKTGKDLKGQIVSVGVLGTFVGIFIGLQAFDPNNIINSVNEILVGLKTAFLTSIVGMSVSTILSITQTFSSKIDNE